MNAIRKLPDAGGPPRGRRWLAPWLLAAAAAISSALAVAQQPTDFGDAPKPYPDASHVINKALTLGRELDSETSSQPNSNATGDDLNPAGAADDEDGVVFSGGTLKLGQVNALVVEVSQTCRLDAWVDWNADGDWDDTGEQIFAFTLIAGGVNNLTVSAPATGKPGATFARFRINRELPLKPDGNVFEGEVEDYQVTLEGGEQNLDFGDAPDKYPVVLGQNGARHQLAGELFLGTRADTEPDGQPSSDANGDDKNPPGTVSDEDGVVFQAPLQAGSNVKVDVTVSGGRALLDAWIDFNQDAVWSDPGEKIFSSVQVSAGVNNLSFAVPTTIVAGPSFARFRLSFKGGLAPTGATDSGEVEDYQVSLIRDRLDFGDAPQNYPVTLAQDGARHIFNPDVFLGQRIDSENDGQPSTNADGDDNAPAGALDDEDGVVFVTNPLRAGAAAQIQVTASTGIGRLDAWVDFNKNGSWNDTGEQIFNSLTLNAGVNNLTFNVPAGAVLDVTAARFRYSLQGGLRPTGSAPNGEVEDYVTRVDRQPLDYGDAPQSYPVSLAQDGARHTQRRDFFLGVLHDVESDGVPSAAASSDDTVAPASVDDEDGVVFPGGAITPGLAQTVQVTASSSGGRLDAWIDFNRDGDWADAGEKVFTAVALSSGANNLTFTAPAGAVTGDSFARFRLSEQGIAAVTGFGGNGEVEDHLVRIAQPAAELDFGDAPRTYPVTLAQDGARHRIVKGINLGRNIDAEKDGQFSTGADGDDLVPTAVDDEDGVVFLSNPLLIGQTARIEVTSSIAEARLDAWMDWNGDGDWDDAGEQIFTSLGLAAGPNLLSINVPAGVQLSAVFSRFRLSMKGGLTPRGEAVDGEVEDYAVLVGRETLDFGDAPRVYPVLLSQDGARHVIAQGFTLGRVIDAETDGQPSIPANGDDINPPGTIDDEDGVRFIGPVLAGQSAVVEVVVSQTGLLDAWIDFNRNGDWNGAPEQIFTSTPVATGTNILNFSVPGDASVGDGAGARFRLSRKGALKPTGLAPDGEVEDYLVSITERRGVPCTERTHRGTNFWVTFPGNYAPDPDNPVVIRLYIVGPRETTGTVTIPGLGYSSNYFIPASRERIIELPKTAELGNANELIERKGINITASQEVAVYGMNRVLFTSDGFLALPTDVIGRRYVIQGYGNEFTGVPDLNGTQFGIVATEDNTSVTITPKVATGAHPAGVGYPVKLNRGETYQLRNTNDFNNDLTGSIVTADKNIAVFGSHQCSTVPNDDLFYCDHLVEQLLPVERAGSFFVAAPLATRTEAVYRIGAVEDGTPINLNGVNVANLNSGQFIERVLAGAVRVFSSKPIFVTQYSPSSDFDGVVNADPFMIVIPSTSMWLNQYLLTAPNMGFAQHYINVVAPNAVIGGLSLDGVAVAAGQFTAIPATALSYARLAVNPGVHSLAAQLAFGVTVYGWGEYDSYGFPGGMFFGDTEPPQLTCPEKITVTLTPGIAGDLACLRPIPDLRSQVRVTDNCGLPERVIVAQDPAPGTLVGPGIHIITLSAADARGTPGFCQVPFEVVDPSPLRLNCPKDMLVNCNTNGGAIVRYEVQAVRSCGPTEAAIVCNPPPGSFFKEGTTTVTCSAVDPFNGQTVTCSFTVTVRCGTAPNNNITVVRNPGSNTFTLTWQGRAVLERSSRVGGDWTPISTSEGSHTVVPTASKEFFRLRLVE